MDKDNYIECIEATNEVLDDIASLNKLYEKEYITLEDFNKIRSNMIDRMITIKEYYG